MNVNLSQKNFELRLQNRQTPSLLRLNLNLPRLTRAPKQVTSRNRMGTPATEKTYKHQLRVSRKRRMTTRTAVPQELSTTKTKTKQEIQKKRSASYLRPSRDADGKLYQRTKKKRKKTPRRSTRSKKPNVNPNQSANLRNVVLK